MKEKKLSFLNLDNDTLNNIIKFNVYNTDIINVIYKNFNEQEVKHKILSMTNVLSILTKLLYGDNYFDTFTPANEDEKYWIKIDYDNNNNVDSIRINTSEILEVIKFLISFFDYAEEVEVEDAIYDKLQEKIDNIYMFRKNFTSNYSNPGNPAYFNYNMDINTKLIKG